MLLIIAGLFNYDDMQGVNRHKGFLKTLVLISFNKEKRLS